MKPNIVNNEQSKRGRIPRWVGPIFWAVGFPLVHIAAPWGLAFLTPRYGWTADRPGNWNCLALLLVIAGSAIVLWAMVLHFVHAPEGWEWERTPRYLLGRGPYTFTRNPMYLAELMLWLGWALFYGSLAVMIGFLVWWMVFSVVVPREERDLAARFGEDYLHYKNAVPRWFGRI